MSYWTEFNRLTKHYEKAYLSKVDKALKNQFKAYLNTGNIDSISSAEIFDVLSKIYIDVGVNWAFQSGKYVKIKKTRKPLGFSDRIARILRDQYKIDILNTSKNIEQTTKDQIRQVLQQATANGWSINEITNRLTSPAMTSMRARLISRTEVIGAANAGAMVNAQDLGATKKIWIAAIDSRTREDHKTLNGKTVGMSEYFSVIDSKGVTRQMMQPGDKNGGPGQVCNCRCAVGFE